MRSCREELPTTTHLFPLLGLHSRLRRLSRTSAFKRCKGKDQLLEPYQKMLADNRRSNATSSAPVSVPATLRLSHRTILTVTHGLNQCLVIVTCLNPSIRPQIGANVSLFVAQHAQRCRTFLHLATVCVCVCAAFLHFWQMRPPNPKARCEMAFCCFVAPLASLPDKTIHIRQQALGCLLVFRSLGLLLLPPQNSAGHSRRSAPRHPERRARDINAWPSAARAHLACQHEHFAQLRALGWA